MNIECGSCSAKYAVPDEKVKGRKVRIKCKKCSTPIIVDGTKLDDAPKPKAEPSPEARKAVKKTIVGGMQAPVGSPKPAAAAAPRPAAEPAKKAVKKTMLGGISPAASEPAKQPEPNKKAREDVKGTIMGGLTPALGSAPAPPEASPPEPAQDQPEPWTVAVTEDDQRELTTAEVADLFVAGTIDDETFIWKEGMDDWLTPFEIPEIAAELKARGATAGGADADPGSQSPLDAAPPSGGAWHEPGSWEPPTAETAGEGGAEIGFDDVTVAMSAPDAAKLAEATAQSEPKLPSAPGDADDQDDEQTIAAPSPLSSPEPDVAEPADAPSPSPGGKLPFELDVPPQSSPEPDGEEAPRPAAARREDARAKGGVDLFGDADADKSTSDDDGKLTGERNENSVLFSLDALAGLQESKSSPKTSKADADFLTSPAETRPAPTVDEPPPSIANLDAGGGLFGQTMTAPDVTAPAAESPPTPESAPVASTDSTAPAPAESSGGSNTLLIVLLLLILIGVAGGAYAYFNWPSSDPAQAGSTATSTAATTAPEPPAPEQSPNDQPPTAAEEKKEPGETEAEEKKEEEKKPEEKKEEEKKPEEKKEEEKKPEEKKEEEKKPEEKKEEKKEEGDLPPFNKSAASAALGGAAGSAASCKKPDGPTGRGRATVTFMPSGRATNAVITGDFAGTAVGGCVARIFRSARIPPFSGAPVTVAKSFSIH